MFLVEKNTIELVFQAQQKSLQGKLRLDISSRRLPSDPSVCVDKDAAREALGERLLRTLISAANDASLLAQKKGWQVPDPPPLPDADNLIRVMPSPDRFEGYLTPRLDQVMGLDHDSNVYGAALAHLAKDLFRWAQKDTAEAMAQCLELRQEQVFVRCLGYDYLTDGLNDRRVMVHTPIGPSTSPSRP